MSQIERKEAEKQPGVYIFQRDSIPLYVGSTANLDDRPMKRDKDHESRYVAILEATETRLIPCESRAKAYQLEELLIRKYQPKFNLRCPRGEADLQRTWNIIRENW